MMLPELLKKRPIAIKSLQLANESSPYLEDRGRLQVAVTSRAIVAKLALHQER